MTYKMFVYSMLGLISVALTNMVYAAPSGFTPSKTTENSMITLKSSHNVTKTADRLEALLKAKGMKIFTRIDHAAGAKSVGKNLRPTELVVFGNPKIGTPLMQCAQTVALDLPQKALIWEDEQGSVWFTYNNPAYLAQRHSIMGCEAVLNKINGALGKFATKATHKD